MKKCKHCGSHLRFFKYKKSHDCGVITYHCTNPECGKVEQVKEDR